MIHVNVLSPQKYMKKYFVVREQNTESSKNILERRTSVQEGSSR